MVCFIWTPSKERVIQTTYQTFAEEMKRARKDGGAKAKPAVKKPPAKRGARKMPPPMPRGEVLTDFTKKTDWLLGCSVGKGGFGEIYTATKSAGKSEDYVVKIVCSTRLAD